jgi:signal transduction histidine kinase
MKRVIIFIILLYTKSVLAQDHEKDSLLMLISKAKEDTTKVNLLYQLSNLNFGTFDADSAFLLAQQGLNLAQSIGYKKGEMNCKRSLAFSAWVLGDFATAVKLGYSVLEYNISVKDTESIIISYGVLINSYRDEGDYRESLKILSKSNGIVKSWKECEWCSVWYAAIGSNYYGLKNFDSALYYLNLALPYPINHAYGWTLLITGRTQEKKNNNIAALDYFKQSIKALLLENNLKDLAGAYSSIADFYEKEGQTDSAIYYGNQALILSQKKKFNKEILGAYLILSKAYEKINTEEALKYYKLVIESNDNLYNQDKQRQILSYQFNEQLHQQELQQQLTQANLAYRNRLNDYFLLGGLVILIIVAGGLWRRNVFKQRSYALLQKQKQETDFQKTKVEKTLEELRSTQAQLIQSEKMASLGELTAGIAHEIQNPLNFVNNFSEVNKELLEELEGERSKVRSERDEELENEIIKDIRENEEKINHHGKRADAIVKGMLQHSRASSGQREPTDIDKLADEYLRLSYHGLRAKDKGFNAEIKTDFDDSIGKINAVPQDIGRVLLNLFNNAFYAVNEKQKAESVKLNGEGGQYVPMVTVVTKKITPFQSLPLQGGGKGAKVEVIVKDNGNGIPQNIIDKIFQPFFTTKPTGQGTGLGLSLAYDIIKAHGGEIKVETKESVGSTFTIQLPVT